MGRSGKRFHRRKHFKPPEQVAASKDCQSYAIITKFHGGHTRSCDVTAYDQHDDKLVNLRAKLKGALKPKSTKSKIELHAFVLLEYGEISLIYHPDNINLIPSHILKKLAPFSSSQYDHANADPQLFLPPDESEDEDDVGGAIFQHSDEEEEEEEDSRVEPFDLDLI